ncbi:cation:proton antiporter [Pseudomarimonas salicorniae]|uniref:Cation:proton antiporter n=1 Tax=Pseudomarimonas salicorniae TaxID=2933270 RepID=A0ABT0GDQ4_9GAMM|nr:cation:proton antiporter [Lysobacter sp. CAU 1642]MCK7592684.1 cation:proton antiporter [Lysobacter sp. CAU 1642]
MAPAHAFLESFGIAVCVAAATSWLSVKLRQPPVLGYLLAGLIVGPYLGLTLVSDRAAIASLSELGVILLMFFLGLEFSLRHLIRVGPRAFVIAFLEVGVMIFAGLSIARAFGFGGVQALFFGGVVAIASTTIIAKVFEEQRPERPLRELVLGVLIVEDLLAVFMLAVFSAIAKTGDASFDGLADTALNLGLFLGGLLLVGMWLVPRLVQRVVKENRPETTLLASVGICFAVVLATEHFGYSVALGAFLAGSLVAESGEEKRIEQLVRPLKDLFTAVFFVAVGMSIDPSVLGEHWPMVLLMTATVLLLKPVAVAFGGFVAGAGISRSVRAGMTMGQIGEFSFIIAGLGLTLGAVDPSLYPIAVAVSAITVLTTPVMARRAEGVARAVDRFLPKPLQTFAALYASWIDDLVRARNRGALGHGAQIRRISLLLIIDAALLCGIVIGAAIGGPQLLGRIEEWVALGDAGPMLMWIATALLIAPFVLTSVRLARALGRRLAKLALPQTAEGVDFAAAPRRAMTMTLEIAIVAGVGLLCLLVTAPFLPPFGGAAVLALIVLALAVALWRSATNLQGHVQAGSLAILDALGKRSPGAGAGSSALALEQVREILPGLGDLQPVPLDTSSACIGQSLGQIGLRSRSGASVLAIRRSEALVSDPDGSCVLEVGDVVVLAGSQEAVQQARAILLGEPEPDEEAGGA